MKTLKSILHGLRLALRFGALVCAVSLAFSVHRAGAQTPLYQASAQEVAGPPGTLIRSEPMMHIRGNSRQCAPKVGNFRCVSITQRSNGLADINND